MVVVLYFFFFSSRRRHTICALVTGVQTCALPICIVPVAYVSPSSRHFTDLAGRRLGKPQSLTPFPFFFPLNPPSGSPSRRQPFDLAGEVPQLTMRFLQVVVGLQTHPEALAGTQRQRPADGGVRGDPTLYARSEEPTSEPQSLMR